MPFNRSLKTRCVTLGSFVEVRFTPEAKLKCDRQAQTTFNVTVRK
jgi:hypothetical protein